VNLESLVFGFDPAVMDELTSAFPPPPAYFKFFTPENLALLKSRKTPETPEKKRELEYLEAPPAPSEGAYSTFGDVWPVPPPLLSAANNSSLNVFLR
jgi:mediator of RNA polymerase II transcription subunit 7